MFDAENLVKKGNVVTVFTKFGLTAMYTTSFFCTTSLLSNDVWTPNSCKQKVTFLLYQAYIYM